MKTSRRRKLAVLALTLSLLSGCSALIHQVVWIRRLIDILGATADTFAAVTGAFFLGLALGGWFSIRLREKSPSIYWRGVAFAEVGIAVLALGVLLAPRSAEWLAALPIPGVILRLGIPLLLVAPPAIGMGLVTPWLIRANAASPWPVAVPVYAINTVGGMLGIVLCLVVLLPVLGTLLAGGVAVALNGLVGLLAWNAGREGSRRTLEKKQAHKADGLRLAPGEAAVAFGSGFLVLAAEVIVQMQMTQVTVNSLFSGGFVLILVLAGLSLGAWGSVGWRRVFREHLDRALGASLLAGGLAFAAQPLLFWMAFGGLRYQPYQVGLAGYFWQILGPGLLCVALPFCLAGVTFPLLLRKLELRAASLGLVFACNGLGGWLGAEVAQGFLLPRLGLWGAISAVGAGYAFLLVLGVRSLRWRLVPASVGVALAVGSWILFSAMPQVRPEAGDRVRALRVGREGVVAVSEGAPDDWRIIFNNSYTLGGSRAAANQERQAHLPILLHGRAESVATLGLATGSTAAGATCHPGVRNIDAIELSPLVMKFAERYFGEFNRNLFSDSRVRPVPGDARWEILRQPAAYDVIVGDLFLPWRTGEGRLFSREHFEAVRRALKPEGLYCQWLPLYQLTEEHFQAIARTFVAVFPDAFLVRGDFYMDKPILGLVGGRKLEEIDWEDVRRSSELLREKDDVTDPLVRHLEGVAMLTVGPLPQLPKGPVITLENNWIEWAAGQNIMAGGQDWFVGVPLAKFIRESHRAGKTEIPPSLRKAHEAGQFFLTLTVAHEARVRHEEMAVQMPSFLPESLRNDLRADWTRWPGSPKPFSP